MDIQSLSICVPARGCPNKCRFCVAHMQKNPYANQIEENERFHDLYKNDYKKRLRFARDNGCNTVILTGDGEPAVNRRFLDSFSEWNQSLPSPFGWVEIQTSGVTIDESSLRYLRNTVGVNTIALSLSDMFSNEQNQDYNRTPENLKIDIERLCMEIKRYDFNLRLSLNMTDAYNDRSAIDIFARLHELQADQVTFRVLYSSGQNTPEDEWTHEHKVNDRVISALVNHIKTHGRPLETLPFGAIRYSVDGISTVIDDDCMSTMPKNTIRYLVLRENCKLYSKWDDKGSLVF